jgi:hypothetical protein
METEVEKRIRRLVRHPSRRLVYSIAFFGWGIYAGSNINDGLPNFAGLAVFWAIAIWILTLYIGDRKFLKTQSAESISRVKDAIASEKQEARVTEASRKQSVKQQKQELKMGTEVTGPALLDNNFGWGTVRIYKNGYIFLSTRMEQPEKLVAISSDTSLMGADTNSHRTVVRGGAILTVVTDGGVYSIKEWTDSKSSYITPAIIARLQEIVVVGNSVIS